MVILADLPLRPENLLRKFKANQKEQKSTGSSVYARTESNAQERFSPPEEFSAYAREIVYLILYDFSPKSITEIDNEGFKLFNMVKSNSTLSLEGGNEELLRNIVINNTDKSKIMKDTKKALTLFGKLGFPVLNESKEEKEKMDQETATPPVEDRIAKIFKELGKPIQTVGELNNLIKNESPEFFSTACLLYIISLYQEKVVNFNLVYPQEVKVATKEIVKMPLFKDYVSETSLKTFLNSNKQHIMAGKIQSKINNIKITKRE